MRLIVPAKATKKERSDESGQAVTVNYVRFKIDPQAETDQLDDPGGSPRTQRSSGRG